MENYTYQELTNWVNKYFKNDPKAKVTVRTIKFWVAKGLLPEPQGGSRWRFFNGEDMWEAISIRKLQIVYGQSIENIDDLRSQANRSPYIRPFEHFYTLSKLVAAIELLEKTGIDIAVEIEAFKKGNRFLVFDEAYTSLYRLVELDQIADVYFEKDGKIYRRLDFITDSEGQAAYFKPCEVEKYLEEELSYTEYLRKEFNLEYKPIDKPTEAKCEAEKIRALIDNEIMISPRYEFKGVNYLSREDIKAGRVWLKFNKNYGLSNIDLKLLHGRIKSDIEKFFYTPEGGLFTETPVFYEFYKQVILFNLCVDFLYNNLVELEESVVGHNQDNSLKLIRDYINGFSFLCRSFYSDYPDRLDICLKNLPISELSPKQLEMGLSQGTFTQQEVEKLLRGKEAEVNAIKSVIEAFSKGKKDDSEG